MTDQTTPTHYQTARTDPWTAFDRPPLEEPEKDESGQWWILSASRNRIPVHALRYPSGTVRFDD